MLDLKLMRDLWKLKTQVITIALVVASAIAGFVTTLSTYDSLRALQSAYYDSARFAHLFLQLKRAPLALEQRIVEIRGIAEAETTITHDVLVDLPGVVEPVTGHVIALPASGEPRMNRLTLAAGRWIHDPRSNEVLVNEAFATGRKLRAGDRIVALLNGKRETLTIAGVVLSPEYIFAGRGGVSDEQSFGIFWMGRERLAAAFNMEGAFNYVSARLSPGASPQVAMDALDRLLDSYGAVGTQGRDEQFSHRALTQEINEQKVFGTVLPSIFLAVAVFLLNVVLTRQIATQRGQIAALKALGYPDRLIGLHYLKFVMVIVALGIVIGIAVGAWLGGRVTTLYAAYFRFPTLDYRLQIWIPLVASTVSVAAAALGALTALRRVIRLPPAEAMRPAAPPLFRRTLLERFGYGRLYSPRARMILRDMERRPLRVMLTTAGIACGVAILIAGTWWRDAVDYLLDVDFRLRERQHVSIVMTDPTSSSALYDLGRLPGVMRVETSRDAPVRLRNGHLDYRTTVSGLARDAQMRQLVGPHLKVTALPLEGILLNDRLARRLDVRAGDSIVAEFLEGERVQRSLVVSGTVGELSEMRAYMNLDNLNRLLGEGDSFTSARVRLDMNARSAFFLQVKETPRIAATLELDPVIRNFKRTSARFILVFTGILSVFAAIIAVGVVYNNARIALAERAWELASLRVLGFTRGEVSALLLYELAIELVVALPIGWLLGYWLSAGILELIRAETFEIPLVIEPRTYAYATVITILAGVVSALVVRRRIDTMDLTAVLKTNE